MGVTLCDVVSFWKENFLSTPDRSLTEDGALITVSHILNLSVFKMNHKSDHK